MLKDNRKTTDCNACNT